MTQLIPLLFVLFLLSLPLVVTAASAPPLMLAKVYQSIEMFEAYSVTEKFDGVRGFWTGKQMLTRSGRTIELPSWFVEQLPAFAVEGELWLGYGRFAEVSGLLHKQDVADPRWQTVAFKIFDAPEYHAVYQERMAFLNRQVTVSNHVQVVDAFQVYSQAELDRALEDVIAAGGEGLMLNRLNALYDGARSDSLLKLKPVEDDEAQVIGYSAGKGKYQGEVGALIVSWNGRIFRIGSGLSDELRRQPPALGAWVTFKYSGFTASGLPRFARYYRPYGEH